MQQEAAAYQQPGYQVPQYDQNGYATQDPGYGQNGYQGYQGYGTGGH
jgi:hypothetical protein